MKKFTTGLAAIALTAALAGCGGGNGPEDAVNDFIAALKDKDAAKTCDLLAPDNQKMITDLNQGSCEDLMKEGLDSAGTDDALDNTNAKVKDSTVDGDKATVTVEADGETNDITVVKVDGEWKVDLFGSLNK